MTLFLLLMLVTVESSRSEVYTNHWAVRVSGGPQQADRVAAKYGYINFGQIGSLEDHYHFHHSRVVRRAAFSLKGPHSFIHMDPEVDWAQQQVVKPRVKRFAQSDPSFIHFNDPKWSNMWYIHCIDKNSQCRSEMNIHAAWQRGYTGKNVVVTILDDGIEWSHPDLAQNYDHIASYDVNGNDHDPTPRYDFRNDNVHGTRCAGEVAAAANNSHCIVGIAYNARIGGIRMLDGDVTDLVEAKSLGVRPDYIDIYSASWGPKDDGKTVDGPGQLTKQAFEQGIKKGRKGLGSIFVWASGNGGRQGDHCSCDGYTSSIYTVSISSATENGNKPWYLEACSSILATTYSSGEFDERKIRTILLFTAMSLLLTWRDVQHLLVKTSRPVHLKADDWKTNAAGLRVSHLYGFGLVDAEAMVVEASKWRTVPPQHTCSRVPERRTRHIHAGQRLNSSITTSGCSGDLEQHVGHLEHVVVKVLIVHPRRGDLEINLISPSGTRTQLLAKRLYDSSNEGFRNWQFMTVHFWGERAEGTWTLEIVDSPSKLRNPEVLGKVHQDKSPQASHLQLKWKQMSLQPKRVDTDPVWHISEPFPAPAAQYSHSRMSENPATVEILEEPEMEEEDEYVGPGKRECIQCAEGFMQQEWRCVQSCSLDTTPERQLESLARCATADEVFCQMVRSNRLCEKKLYRKFCCHTCVMNG
ncbi:hypothetical protein F7725_026813 [Dissostichus mawsoni]|uniref:SPC3 n=1 Tax=Dissostichus mawsoni TaxID=36200 RepID=A0A7J5X9M3_DISMA|nr:hypothetical protein F7725_026813 [Dissostichus mawsoni]